MKTKIIDFHIHIGLKEHWHDWVHDYQKGSGSDFYDRYDELTDPARFARYLEECGIDQAVILPEISPITTGIVPNEYVLDFCRDRDIYIPFCTINPSLSSNPLQELKGWIDAGAGGLKLYPSYNHFFPNDRQLYPLYSLLQEESLPILVHTGSSVFPGAKIKYSDPLHLDDLAADFPKLKILMAHGGRGFWYDRAFFLTRLHPNLFLEISGLPPSKLQIYYPNLETQSDKIVFGSDWPGVKSLKENIRALKALPLQPESISRILYRNAAAILGMDKHAEEMTDDR